MTFMPTEMTTTNEASGGEFTVYVRVASRSELLWLRADELADEAMMHGLAGDLDACRLAAESADAYAELAGHVHYYEQQLHGHPAHSHLAASHSSEVKP